MQNFKWLLKGRGNNLLIASHLSLLGCYYWANVLLYVLPKLRKKDLVEGYLKW